MPIRFFKEGVRLKIPRRKQLVDTLTLIGLVEQKQLGDINVIFVSDSRLLQINRQYLNHDFYTDIVTFQYPAAPPVVSGDLFISIERVSDNAERLSIEFTEELCRVIIHGVLHLCGYRDKQPVDKKLMRKKEDFYLDSMKSL